MLQVIDYRFYKVVDYILKDNNSDVSKDYDVYPQVVEGVMFLQQNKGTKPIPQ